MYIPTLRPLWKRSAWKTLQIYVIFCNRQKLSQFYISLHEFFYIFADIFANKPNRSLCLLVNNTLTWGVL